MKLWLSDLLIGMGICAIAAVAAIPAEHFFWGEDLSQKFMMSVSMLGAGIVYLLITPPIYRLFRLRPMWYPKCPHCGDKNRSYYFRTARTELPCDFIVCAACRSPIRLWYQDPGQEKLLSDMPAYRLYWPQSIGRWKRMTEADSDRAADVD